MKSSRHRVIGIAVLLVAVLLSGCADKRGTEATLARTGKERISIILSSNVMTKKEWSYTASLDGIVKKVEADPANEVYPGSTTFSFTGLKPGDVTLSFSYVKPGNPGLPLRDFATYQIRVYPDNSLEIISFYQEMDSAGPGKKAVSIVLEGDVHSGKVWRYTASKKGIVSEGTERDLVEKAADGGESGIVLPDVILGARKFVFTGVQPGEVELHFTYSSPDKNDAPPEDTATFKLKVFSDKSLYIIGTSREVY